MRIVIKVGTSTLTHKTGMLNIRGVGELCRVIADLKNAGNEIILVSSGAIGMGVGKLQLGSRPDDMPTKQAAAAVGQCELMYTYDKLFSEYRHTVAQILVTQYDIDSDAHREHFRNTLFRLLELNTIPIINENDTVATAEIAIGDNDVLGAEAAVNADADLLVILSDIDGLYTADPHKNADASLIHEVRDLDSVVKLATGSISGQGTGGMETKIKAARIAAAAGIDTVIASGADPEILYTIAEGGQAGTRFFAAK
ncbi:MAG: glutamate 5-kinase [Parasporobacterium sp.]|nr:glutamate 5-kinase [Parasporobacterium sp.]